MQHVDALGQVFDDLLGMFIGIQQVVGTALYVAARVTGATPAEILRPLMPFLVATLLILILLCWQPYLVTALID